MAISTKISGDVPPVFSKNSLIPQAYGDADGPEILVQMPLGERFWRTMVQLNNASENANVWDVCLDVFGMFVDVFSICVPIMMLISWLLSLDFLGYMLDVQWATINCVRLWKEDFSCSKWQDELTQLRTKTVGDQRWG